MLKRYLKKILNTRVYDVAVKTPLEPLLKLSSTLNNQILLKREDLQPVFSFKLRGAYHKISMLSEAQRSKGIIASSAGNHAQGVALSAKKLGIKALIVMPVTTPSIKVDSVKRKGAKVILHGDDYSAAYEQALVLASELGMTFVHPYDDVDVIAGQATVAVEILEQIDEGGLDIIFVPVGGGGLAAGIIAYVKSKRPKVRVIGVEADDAACLSQALEKGRRVVLKQVGIFADGVAVKQIGKEPFKLLKKYMDDVVLVSTDEICAAIMDIYVDTRAIAEPAGALSLAGLKKYVAEHDINNETLVAINSGANINFDRLRYVAERAELGEQKEALFAVTIPEKPGAFRRFCRTIGKRSVTEFNYRYADDKKAVIFVGIELKKGKAEAEELLQRFNKQGYEALDMTDNEMAKLHVRYMVGGHPSDVSNEVLYRFEFPERPGALLGFLDGFGHQWNISLFHYRNHGAAFGRVLVGVQVPEADRKRFKEFLGEVGFFFVEETENPAYLHFLS